MSMLLPVYIINLKSRPDRRKHIVDEFKSRKEFKIQLTDAIRSKKGNTGLWDTIQHILRGDVHTNFDFIIICEDDHQFTSDYGKEKLFTCIEEAKKKDADVLSGGVSGFTSAIPVSNNLYWVETFSGLQFTVIFKKFFKTILEADFGHEDAADYKISGLTDKIFFIYPFISVQKDFGYSDVTPDNNVKGHVEEAFRKCNEKITLLKHVGAFYKENQPNTIPDMDFSSWHNIIVPTYIIGLSEKSERKKHVQDQFKSRIEFDIRIVDAVENKIKSFGLWLSIRKVIQMALENEDDIIIICEDDHEFTEFYTARFLMQNIMEAYLQFADYLLGGAIGFESAIPIAKNRFWINQCLAVQFLVIYKKFFKRIMEEPFDQDVQPELLLSEMTANKMVLYPFISSISRQNCSSAKGTSSLKRPVENQSNLFEVSSQRLQTIGEVYYKYL